MTGADETIRSAGATTVAAVTDAAADAWDDVLERMERDLAEIRGGRHESLEAWEPPHPGRVPASLLPRLARLMREQEQVLEQLATERSELAGVLAALRDLPATAPIADGHYLDRSA